MEINGSLSNKWFKEQKREAEAVEVEAEAVEAAEAAKAEAQREEEENSQLQRQPNIFNCTPKLSLCKCVWNKIIILHIVVYNINTVLHQVLILYTLARFYQTAYWSGGVN